MCLKKKKKCVKSYLYPFVSRVYCKPFLGFGGNIYPPPRLSRAYE